jgi:23S rRNA pseudouridine2605 synthase
MSESEDSDNSTRLNKFLALHVGTSRREADELITKGRVSINGHPAIIGARVREGDVVTVNGKEISTQTAFEYLMLHKPIDYVCSRKQQGDSPTIYELIPPEYHALKPVGRLDRDSSGLILLSNDGDFAQQMTHPSYRKVKRYNVTLGRALEPLHQQMISDFGIDLDDGKSQLTLERQTDDRKKWTVTMSEGRNRQIRRTFAALGYMVSKLHRTDFGPYTLGDLAPGKYEKVSKL